jgi:hypothetical protein
VDAERGRAQLAQVAGSGPTEVRLLTVELATGQLSHSSESKVLEPAYHLSGAGITLLQDGRIFITGGSEDGSNFKPVRHTLLVTPGMLVTRPQLQVEKGTGAGITLSWNVAEGSFVIETSTNLLNWTPMTMPAPEDGRIAFSVATDEAARFFRLRQASR